MVKAFPLLPRDIVKLVAEGVAGVFEGPQMNADGSGDAGNADVLDLVWDGHLEGSDGQMVARVLIYVGIVFTM